MAARDISNFFIYRWRYIVGYTIIGLLLAGLLVFAGLYIPGGVSQSEINSAVTSNSISLSHPSSFAVTSLPFHLLQHRIFDIFGVSDFTIKLPSLIMSLLSALGLILLLRRWFSPRTAVITSLLAVTTGQFLFIAQNGAPGASYIFWPVLLLLLGTQVTRAKRGRLFWKLLFAAATALSLYNPLSIYPLIAIVLATVLHPHLRAVVRRLSKTRVAISLVIAAILVTPLAVMIAYHPHLGLMLLGAPANWPPDLGANTMNLLKQYFDFWEPSTTTLMTPVFGLGSALIILLGVYRLIRTRETTRSYLVIIWVICLIPVLIINPGFTSVTFVPAVLLLAAGITSLFGYWYRLFPLNPYARITGLIPIVILVVTLVGSGLDRYIYGYHYSPTNAVNFSNDLRLLPKNTKVLVVANDELPFYKVVADHRKGLTVTIATPNSNTPEFTATRAARDDTPSGYQVARIITNTYTNDSDRLYVYKKI